MIPFIDKQVKKLIASGMITAATGRRIEYQLLSILATIACVLLDILVSYLSGEPVSFKLAVTTLVSTTTMSIAGALQKRVRDIQSAITDASTETTPQA